MGFKENVVEVDFLFLKAHFLVFQVCLTIFRDSATEQRELLCGRQYLDHRRLEEGFLFFAALQVMKRYKITFDDGKSSVPVERNKMMEMVVKVYEKVFYEKWTGVLHVLLMCLFKLCSFTTCKIAVMMLR